MTHTSFGLEFDRLMFEGGDATAGGLGASATAPAAHKPGGAEDETMMDLLRAGTGAGAASAKPGAALDSTELDPRAFSRPPATPPPAAAGSAAHKAALPPTPAVVDVSLAQTLRLPPQGAGAPGGGEPAAPPTDPARAQQALFQAQRQKGLEAFAAGDWGQAVHFLSVAVSIHPEDQEISQKLQEARRQRRTSGGA